MITEGNRIELELTYGERELARRIPGYRWHPESKSWSWHVTSIIRVQQLFPRYAEQLGRDYSEYKQRQLRIAAAADDIHNILGITDEPEVPRETFDLNKEIAHIKLNSDFRLQPYKHQEKMIKAGLKYHKFAFFCEMGTGKTKVGIDLVRIKQPRRCLVLCPCSVITSWADECEKNGFSSYVLVKGTKKQRIAALSREDAQLFITNYETLLSIGPNGLWSTFDMVILDESSRIKSPKAKRTKFIVKTFKDVRYKYIFSGTPITQGLVDIYCQFQFLDSKWLEHSNYYSFRDHYCVMGGYQGYQVVGYRHEDELKDKINRHSIQLKKQDCEGVNLPEKVYQKRVLDMSPVMAKQYKEMKDEAIIELENGDNVTAAIVLTKMLRLQEITAGSYVGEGDNHKIKEIKEIIDESIQNNNQVVIFARFRKSMDLLAKTMASLGIEYSRIDGSTKDRDAAIHSFQDGSHKVIICQEQAAGLGINLQAGSVMIYYENTFSLEERKQSEDRIHRIGQKLGCVYIDLVYDGTVDVDVLKAISRKQDVANYLVDSFVKGNYTIEKKIKRRAG